MVAPVDDGVGRSSKRMKKLFGCVPTLIKLRAAATHDGDQTWTMPSTVRMGISGLDDRLPLPKPTSKS